MASITGKQTQVTEITASYCVHFYYAQTNKYILNIVRNQKQEGIIKYIYQDEFLCFRELRLIYCRSLSSFKLITEAVLIISNN
jgi:hypothetical protein